MKTGIGTIAAVEVQCPNCREYVTGQNGSHLLAENDSSGLKAGQVVACDSCGTRFRLPALLAKVGR